MFSTYGILCLLQSHDIVLHVSYHLLVLVVTAVHACAINHGNGRHESAPNLLKRGKTAV